MKIEVGKYYRTKNGDKARIYATDGGFGKSIHGAFLRSDGAWIPMWWTSDGKSSCFKDFVIISEWTEPIDFDKSCLPAWAEWIAMNDRGRWFWYCNKPNIHNNEWFPVNLQNYGQIPPDSAPKNYTGDWKDSLRKVSDL